MAQPTLLEISCTGSNNNNNSKTPKWKTNTRNLQNIWYFKRYKAGGKNNEKAFDATCIVLFISLHNLEEANGTYNAHV